MKSNNFSVILLPRSGLVKKTDSSRSLGPHHGGPGSQTQFSCKYDCRSENCGRHQRLTCHGQSTAALETEPYAWTRCWRTPSTALSGNHGAVDNFVTAEKVEDKPFSDGTPYHTLIAGVPRAQRGTPRSMWRQA